MHLNELAELSEANSASKGFWDDEPEYGTPEHKIYIGNKLMLIVGEVAEAHEELRKGYEYTDEYLTYPDSASTVGKPEGFPSEMADIIIRAGDLCAHLGIDLEAAIETKRAYNASREKMHGKKF